MGRWDRLPIAEIVNVKGISLDEAPDTYRRFDAGVAVNSRSIPTGN
jgi:glutathione-independent formaldehyde dehydrogenase